MWVIKLLFCVLFLLEMLLNFDSGGTPAVLEFITVDFRLTPGQQGLLGAFPYIGTLFMSPFAGQLLSRYNPKICVCVSLALNTFFCAMFAFSPVCTNPEGNCAGSYILLGCKLAIGISQACILIYLPVWVDEVRRGGGGLEAMVSDFLRLAYPSRAKKKTSPSPLHDADRQNPYSSQSRASGPSGCPYSRRVSHWASCLATFSPGTWLRTGRQIHRTAIRRSRKSLTTAAETEGTV